MQLIFPPPDKLHGGISRVAWPERNTAYAESRVTPTKDFSVQ